MHPELLPKTTLKSSANPPGNKTDLLMQISTPYNNKIEKAMADSFSSEITETLPSLPTFADLEVADDPP